MARMIGTHLIATEAEILASIPDLHRATAYATDTRNRWVASEDGSTWLTDAGLYASYYTAWDQKATTTVGGAFNNGAWRTRDLTNETDPDGIGALAANQVTLDAGTYRCIAIAPGFAVNRHALRLQNTTGATTLIEGQCNYAPQAVSASTLATLEGRFTIAGGQALEVQHQCQTTKAVDGFGLAHSFGGNEIFATVEFWKEV